jgi:hypothetical protein
MGVGLVIGFIRHFDTVRDYYTYTSVHSHVFAAVAWKRLSMADVPLPLGSRTVSVPQLQTLTATAHNDCTPAVL